MVPDLLRVEVTLIRPLAKLADVVLKKLSKLQEQVFKIIPFNAGVHMKFFSNYFGGKKKFMNPRIKMNIGRTNLKK